MGLCLLQVAELVMAGRLKPRFQWLSPLVGNCEPGGAVSGAVFVFTCFSTALCIQLHFSSHELTAGVWWTVLLASFFITCLAGCMYTGLSIYWHLSGPD